MVKVRDEYLCDFAARFLQAVLEQLREPLDSFARVDQRAVLAVSDNVTVCPLQLERAGVQAENAMHERRELLVVREQLESGGECDPFVDDGGRCGGSGSHRALGSKGKCARKKVLMSCSRQEAASVHALSRVVGGPRSQDWTITFSHN